MIFGRKKRKEAQLQAQLSQDELELAQPQADVIDELTLEQLTVKEDSTVDEQGEEAELDVYENSKDWREDGPFDISEVDLDADDVQRYDFGALVITPFDGMDLQMRVNPANGQIQAILASRDQSAIEVFLLAAPKNSSLKNEIRDQLVSSTRNSGGTASLAKGPFGAEIKALLPTKTQDGRTGYTLSRIWLVQGPGWILRGRVMGKAGMASDLSGTAELLYEFFSNIVVRRDNSPKVPGSVIALTLPEELAAIQKEIIKN